MGQAWCKEKTTKAQDSKSPLDRVFVRCAHRIYPSLKEEGSVLGGATQRVTSSEIGYAGSPPREVLTRGRSIDSVDRPFHPSDWVDVNLEVPCTPRPSSVLTNLTVDTSLYPATNPTSSSTNLKDVTPVPPPRRRKRNKGRPLPPKPDEISAENPKKTETGGDEPLYSSVRSPKSSGDEQEQEEETKHRSQDDEICDGRRTKEIYEHKVNGTGRIISSDVVSGRRSFDNSQRKAYEEYERFARNRTSGDSSTPNREEKRKPRQIEDSPKDPKKSSSDGRTKNYSTVSLPNYDELDVTRHRSEETDDREQKQDKARKSRRPVRSSTGSLPAETFLSPFSEKTSVRLEDYIPRSDSLSPYQVLQKLDCGANGVVKDEYVKYDSSKSEDWELADIDNCKVNHQRRFSFEDASEINGEGPVRGEDVVDFSTCRKDERESHSTERDISRSPIHLEKPEAFGKTPSSVLGQPVDTEVDPNRSHLRYYEPPTLTDCKISSTCESPASKAPFFLDETKHRLALDTIEETTKSNPKSDRSDQSRTIFTRSLSNESEPNEDTFETKELESRACDLVRTISKESLPREMLEEQELDGFFNDKHAKNAHNKLKKSLDDRKSITPPPSPESKIKSEMLDSDHSALLKVLKEETAEGSNLSSMTPSLTELEAALSDMLEKEDSAEGSKESNGSNEQILKDVESDESKTSEQVEKKILENPDDFKNIETKSNDENLVDSKGKNEATVALKQVLEDRKPPGRKVSFCSWEESVANLETRKDRGFVELPVDLNKEDQKMENAGCPVDIPPEKPSRLNRNLDDVMESVDVVPTPPRRRNRSLGVVKKEPEVAQNGSAVKEALPNDRLI